MVDIPGFSYLDMKSFGSCVTQVSDLGLWVSDIVSLTKMGKTGDKAVF